MESTDFSTIDDMTIEQKIAPEDETGNASGNSNTFKKTVGARRKLREIEEFRLINKYSSNYYIKEQLKNNRALKRALNLEVKERIENIINRVVICDHANDRQRIIEFEESSVLNDVDYNHYFNKIRRLDLDSVISSIKEDYPSDGYDTITLMFGRAFDKSSKKIFKVINLEYLYKEEFIQKIHAFRRGEHPFDADKAAIEAGGIQYKYFRYSNCSYISDSRMVRNFLRTELPRHFKNIVDLNAFKITITNKKTLSENDEIEPSPSCFFEPKETIEIDSAVSVFQKSAALPEQVKAFIKNEKASIAKTNCNKYLFSHRLKHNHPLAFGMFEIAKKFPWLIAWMGLNKIPIKYVSCINSFCTYAEMLLSKDELFRRNFFEFTYSDNLIRIETPNQIFLSHSKLEQSIMLLNDALIGLEQRDSLDDYLRSYREGKFLKDASAGDAIFSETLKNKAEVDCKEEFKSDSAISKQLFEETELNLLESRLNSRNDKNGARKNILDELKKHGGATRKVVVFKRNIERMKGVLKQKHPNFFLAIDHIFDNLLLQSFGDRSIKWSPLLLVGSPSIGKTEFVLSIAELFKLPYEIIDLSTAQSSTMLVGSESHWANSHPGAIHELITSTPYINGICVLDEVDKSSPNPNNLPISALYGLLEARSATKFKDLFVGVPMDASHINWIATANTTSTIPDPILSRFCVITIPDPTANDLKKIAGHIYRRMVSKEPWGKKFDRSADDEVLDVLATLKPRDQQRALRKAFICALRANRTALLATDVITTPTPTPKHPFGFLSQ